MILPIICGILITLIIVVVNPAFAEPFDAIKVVEESTIQVDGKTIHLTNMYERQFLNSPIIKVQAEALSGETVLIFFNMYNPDHVKVIVFDGQFKKGKLTKNPIVIEESETDEPSILKYNPELNFEYFITKPIMVGNDFTINVKTYDNKKHFAGFFSINNSLEKVKMQVELAQERTEIIVVNEKTSYEEIIENDWETIKIMNGTTSKYGKWIGGQVLPSGIFLPDRWMQITITATLDDQIIKKTEKLFVSEIVFGRDNKSHLTD